jgi:hypothetical protein
VDLIPHPKQSKNANRMKKKYILGVALTALLSTGAFAQAHRNCGTMEHLHEMTQQDPGLTNRMQQIERETEQWISSQTANRAAAVVTIPVVVHVVYNTTSQNISDAQIQSQINILNQDFRKLNSDVSLVPSVFAPLAADCEIQFCLAQRDPNGNATNGIVRRSTTVTSFSTNDNIKRNANGGSDPWNTSQYLNIWVGNLSGGLLGYAQFPGGTAATDGVVCTFTAFGNTGTAAAPFNKGRTATHEVGHWLNLRHIWGDATCGNDQVTDTPTQSGPNYGCPAFPKVSCSNGPNGDMHMNYMDYTDDACMYMFTAGQKSRMLAALNGTRASLLSSQGCVPPVTTGCGTPGSLSATSITTTSATLNWSAVSGAQSYNVQYRVNGTTTWTTVTSTTTSRSITGLAASTAYQYQVQAVCSSATGTYSPIATFTTAATTCTDPYESNNSRTTARAIPVNTDIRARIGTSTDRDWFSFSTVSGSTNLRAVLDQLPLDYDLRLYNSAGTQLAVSQNGGTASETITRNTTTAASYFVRVEGYNGAFSTTSCYRLRLNTSGTPFRGSVEDETIGNVNMEKIEGLQAINLFPNPAGEQLNINFFVTDEAPVNAQVIDMIGKTVMNQVLTTTEGFNQTQLSLENLQNGIYFVRMQHGEQVIVKKFVVKH